MYQINKPPAHIDVSDLQRLLDERVRESKTIEYKKTLYRLDPPTKDERKSLTDEDRRKREADRSAQIIELLKDVSAFANTIGGYLFLGIKQGSGTESGIPVELCGVQCDDPEAKTRQMTQLIEQWIDPRIQCEIHPVTLPSGQYVFAVRVLDSTVSPHRVDFDDHGHFYSRTSAGAVRMDTSDLRQAFTMTETIIGRLRQFQRSRIQMISAGEQPVRLLENPRVRIAAHLIPFQAFSSSAQFSIRQLQEVAIQRPQMLDGHHGSEGRRINLDGLLSASDQAGEFGYTQLFRSGIIEAVNAYVASQPNGHDRVFLNIDEVERQLVFAIPQFIACLDLLGVMPPVWCFLTIVNSQGVQIRNRHFPTPRAQSASPVCTSPTIAIPETVIHDITPNQTRNEIARPLCDMLRNAFGQQASPNFLDDDKFVVPQ